MQGSNPRIPTAATQGPNKDFCSPLGYSRIMSKKNTMSIHQVVAIAKNYAAACGEDGSTLQSIMEHLKLMLSCCSYRSVDIGAEQNTSVIVRTVLSYFHRSINNYTLIPEIIHTTGEIDVSKAMDSMANIVIRAPERISKATLGWVSGRISETFYPMLTLIASRGLRGIYQIEIGALMSQFDDQQVSRGVSLMQKAGLLYSKKAAMRDARTSKPKNTAIIWATIFLKGLSEADIASLLPSVPPSNPPSTQASSDAVAGLIAASLPEISLSVATVIAQLKAVGGTIDFSALCKRLGLDPRRAKNTSVFSALARMEKDGHIKGAILDKKTLELRKPGQSGVFTRSSVSVKTAIFLFLPQAYKEFVASTDSTKQPIDILAPEPSTGRDEYPSDSSVTLCSPHFKPPALYTPNYTVYEFSSRAGKLWLASNHSYQSNDDVTYLFRPCASMQSTVDISGSNLSPVLSYTQSLDIVYSLQCSPSLDKGKKTFDNSINESVYNIRAVVGAVPQKFTYPASSISLNPFRYRLPILVCLYSFIHASGFGGAFLSAISSELGIHGKMATSLQQTISSLYPLVSAQETSGRTNMYRFWSSALAPAFVKKGVAEASKQDNSPKQSSLRIGNVLSLLIRHSIYVEDMPRCYSSDSNASNMNPPLLEPHASHQLACNCVIDTVQDQLSIQENREPTSAATDAVLESPLFKPLSLIQSICSDTGERGLLTSGSPLSTEANSNIITTDYGLFEKGSLAKRLDEVTDQILVRHHNRFVEILSFVESRSIVVETEIVRFMRNRFTGMAICPKTVRKHMLYLVSRGLVKKREVDPSACSVLDDSACQQKAFYYYCHSDIDEDTLCAKQAQIAYIVLRSFGKTQLTSEFVSNSTDSSLANLSLQEYSPADSAFVNNSPRLPPTECLNEIQEDNQKSRDKHASYILKDFDISLWSKFSLPGCFMQKVRFLHLLLYRKIVVERRFANKHSGTNFTLLDVFSEMTVAEYAVLFLLRYSHLRSSILYGQIPLTYRSDFLVYKLFLASPNTPFKHVSRSKLNDIININSKYNVYSRFNIFLPTLTVLGLVHVVDENRSILNLCTSTNVFPGLSHSAMYQHQALQFPFARIDALLNNLSGFQAMLLNYAESKNDRLHDINNTFFNIALFNSNSTPISLATIRDASLYWRVLESYVVLSVLHVKCGNIALSYNKIKISMTPDSTARRIFTYTNWSGISADMLTYLAKDCEHIDFVATMRSDAPAIESASNLLLRAAIPSVQPGDLDVSEPFESDTLYSFSAFLLVRRILLNLKTCNEKLLIAIEKSIKDELHQVIASGLATGATSAPSSEASIAMCNACVITKAQVESLCREYADSLSAVLSEICHNDAISSSSTTLSSDDQVVCTRLAESPTAFVVLLFKYLMEIHHLHFLTFEENDFYVQCIKDAISDYREALYSAYNMVLGKKTILNVLRGRSHAFLGRLARPSLFCYPTGFDVTIDELVNKSMDMFLRDTYHAKTQGSQSSDYDAGSPSFSESEGFSGNSPADLLQLNEEQSDTSVYNTKVPSNPAAAKQHLVQIRSGIHARRKHASARETAGPLNKALLQHLPLEHEVLDSNPFVMRILTACRPSHTMFKAPGMLGAYSVMGISLSTQLIWLLFSPATKDSATILRTSSSSRTTSEDGHELISLFNLRKKMLRAATNNELFCSFHYILKLLQSALERSSTSKLTAFRAEDILKVAVSPMQVDTFKGSARHSSSAVPTYQFNINADTPIDLSQLALSLINSIQYEPHSSTGSLCDYSCVANNLHQRYEITSLQHNYMSRYTGFVTLFNSYEYVDSWYDVASRDQEWVSAIESVPVILPIFKPPRQAISTNQNIVFGGRCVSSLYSDYIKLKKSFQPIPDTSAIHMSSSSHLPSHSNLLSARYNGKTTGITLRSRGSVSRLLQPSYIRRIMEQKRVSKDLRKSPIFMFLLAGKHIRWTKEGVPVMRNPEDHVSAKTLAIISSLCANKATLAHSPLSDNDTSHMKFVSYVPQDSVQLNVEALTTLFGASIGSDMAGNHIFSSLVSVICNGSQSSVYISRPYLAHFSHRTAFIVELLSQFKMFDDPDAQTEIPPHKLIAESDLASLYAKAYSVGSFKRLYYVEQFNRPEPSAVKAIETEPAESPVADLVLADIDSPVSGTTNEPMSYTEFHSNDNKTVDFARVHALRQNMLHEIMSMPGLPLIHLYRKLNQYAPTTIDLILNTLLLDGLCTARALIKLSDVLVTEKALSSLDEVIDMNLTKDSVILSCTYDALFYDREILQAVQGEPAGPSK